MATPSDIYKNKNTGLYFLNNGESYNPGKKGNLAISSGATKVTEYANDTETPWYVDPALKYVQSVSPDNTRTDFFSQDAAGSLTPVTNNETYKKLQSGELNFNTLEGKTDQEKMLKEANPNDAPTYKFQLKDGSYITYSSLNGADGALQALKNRGYDVKGPVDELPEVGTDNSGPANINYGNEGDGEAGKQGAHNGSSNDINTGQPLDQAPQDGMLSSADAGMLPGAPGSSAQGAQAQGGGNMDVITDPVTGQSYSRDLSIPGSTYRPYNGQIPNAPASTIASPNHIIPPQDANQPTTLDNMLADYGYAVSAYASNLFKQAPVASWIEAYSSVLSSQDQGSKKARDEWNKKLEKHDQELADKISDVNENPWLTEGIRVREIQKLQDRYDVKRAAIAANESFYENKYNKAQELAMTAATQLQQQYNSDRTFNLAQIKDMQDTANKIFNANLDVQDYYAKRSDQAYSQAQDQKKFDEGVREFNVGQANENARSALAHPTDSTTYDENGNVIQTGNYDALTIGRYNRAVNAATSVLQKNPTFKNIIGSSAYLDRIEAAVQNPGSVGDQELLDAFTQLNTGGNRVTEAQVHLITGNQSLADILSKVGNKLSSGGALSAQQRTEIVNLAHEVYKNYQTSYQPLYKDATARLQAQGIPEQFWNIPSPDTLSRAVSDTSGNSGGGSTQSSSPLAAIKSQITFQGNTAYLPRSVWDSLGADKDAALAEAAADGYKLLIK